MQWDKLGKSLPYETCFLQWVSPLYSILHYGVLSCNVYLQVHLRGYVNRLFAAITCSAMACPTVMCQVFHNIREAAAWKFPSKMLHNFKFMIEIQLNQIMEISLYLKDM